MGLLSLFSKKTYKVYIDGMNCSHCSKRVEDALSSIPGTKATVNLEEKYAIVTSRKSFSDDEFKNIVEALGFTFVKSE